MRSIYLAERKASQTDLCSIVVDPLELQQNILKFEELDPASSQEEVFAVLSYLSEDSVVSCDAFIEFASRYYNMAHHTLSLLKEDTTYGFLARILNLLVDPENFVEHLERVDFDELTICQEQFVCEMFQCSDILRNFIYKCSLPQLWVQGRCMLATELAQQITAELNLRFSDKLLEVDGILASLETQKQFSEDDVMFIAEITGSGIYTDRIVALLGSIRPDEYVEFLHVALALTSIVVPSNTFLLLFNIAMYTLEERSDISLGLLQKLIFMNVEFELFESNFSIIARQLNASRLCTLEAVFFFLGAFVEHFVILRPMQLEVLCEDAQIIEKASQIAMERDLSTDLAFAITSLIRELIVVSPQELDYFLEVRFDVLDSLASCTQLRLFEDFDFLLREYGN